MFLLFEISKIIESDEFCKIENKCLMSIKKIDNVNNFFLNNVDYEFNQKKLINVKINVKLLKCQNIYFSFVLLCLLNVV